ncbi:MAG: S8/S53 family peptidase [Thermomicrobiales bacterium]
MEAEGQERVKVLHHLPGELLIALDRSIGQAVEVSAREALERVIYGWLGAIDVGRDESALPRARQIEPIQRFDRNARETTEVHLIRFTDGDRQLDSSRIREIVANLNGRLREGRGSERYYTLRDGNNVALGTIRAVSPNFLAASAQGWGTGGGPGLPPEPIPPVAPLPLPGITFTTDTLRAALGAKADPKEQVVVAVLDTSPQRDEARDAATEFLYSAGNTFLDWVTRSIEFEYWPLKTRIIPEYRHIVPYWAERAEKWTSGAPMKNRDTFFNIVDHGLFAAGLVRSVAPEAKIHLFRVLDDVGIGDTMALLTALNAIPGRLRKQYGRKIRLIINLSLLVEEPDDHRVYGVDDPGDLHWMLQAAVDALRHQDVLVVAAVGNDSFALAQRREPRLPARYESVFSVAATDRDGNPATYSNLGDTDVLDNGIAVFGGNAALAGAVPTIAGAGSKGRPDGLVGAFTRKRLPCSRGMNKTGLVYWAGTSFAAPVITGIAAQLWSRAKAPTTPAGMVERVRCYATDDETATLKVKAIDAKA